MPIDIQLKSLKELSRKEIFLSLARVPNSSRLLLGASDGHVFEVDPLAESPEFKPLPGHGSFVMGVALAGNLLISGGYDCRLLWRRLDGGDVVHSIERAHARAIRKVIASPDGQWVASVADDMVCRVWNAESAELVHELRGHEALTPHHFPSMLYTCDFSPDGQQLATADKTGRICVWDVCCGQRIFPLDGSGFYTWDPRQRIHSIGGIRTVAFSPDGKLLVAGGIGTISNIDHLDGPARVELFDLLTGQSVHVFSGETKGLIETVLFEPKGNWLIGMGGDNAGLWQLYDRAEKKVVRSDKTPMHVHAASFSEDGTRLFAAGHGKVVAWEVTAM